MSPYLRYASELAFLTTAYWMFDFLIRRDGYHNILKQIGWNDHLARISWLMMGILLSFFWPWRILPQYELLQTLSIFLTGFLAWKATTKDIDPVLGQEHTLEKTLVLLAVAGSYFSPAMVFVALFLLTSPFALWEHHATMPMRMGLALLAFFSLHRLLQNTLFFQDLTTLLFFLLVIQISHYLITALAKIFLGPKWYSWVLDNQVHHLTATSYSWGWARFMQWSTWFKLIRLIKFSERPMQGFAFGIELLAPLALLHPHLAMAFCIGWAGFHIGVFITAGLLFWDWILADLIMAYIIWHLPANATPYLFGPTSVLIGILFMLLFPLRHKLWKPMPLGWWDTPFTQRIHWRVHTDDGQEYGLYNNFMCPHERLYGKVHACFAAPKPVMTYHLGEVWKHTLRDALRAAGPDPDALDKVRREFGVDVHNEQMKEHHVSYLKHYFKALNNGAKKHTLPTFLRWLKAPGGQIFYWGDLPPYRGKKKVIRVSLHYREEYFDGHTLQRIHDEHILDVEIDADEQPKHAAIREFTPKEIDHYLLAHAKGKLIDLPGYNEGYVNTDDGKAKTRTPIIGA